LASARSVFSGFADFTAAALSSTACRAALTRSPNDSVFAAGSPYCGPPTVGALVGGGLP
jgi:hypothetical protein